MSTTDYPMGRTLTFTPDPDVDLSFRAAAITKADALRIGLDFCEASDPEREALLAELGGVIVRKSLRILAQTATKVGDDDAAAFATDLRVRVGGKAGA